MVIIYSLFIINYIYAGEIPLINALSNSGTYYRNIEMIPTLYPLVTAINVYFIIYMGAYIVQNKDYKILIFILLLELPLILNLARGIITMSLIPIVLIYISSKKISRMKISKIVMFMSGLLLFLYGFGYFGSIRTVPDALEHYPKSEVIIILGDASDGFINSFIPNNYFWTYIYVVSPLGNLNNIIENKTSFSFDFTNFFAYDFLPNSISKRIIDLDLIPVKENLVVDTFNVSTAFNIPYYYFGWLGIIIFILIINSMYILSKKIVNHTPYESIIDSIFSMIFILFLFDNVYILDVVFIPLMLFIFKSILEKNNFGKDIK